ncbi:MAG: HAD-IA family hydrolase [Candidatus Latescibacterota bacterium]|jgi:FMN phosphatase YigB (HAD superfamily)
MKTNKTEALLFDLGGVLVEIDFDLAFGHWQSFTTLSVAEMKSVFHFDLAYEKHERGEIGAEAYFAHLRTLLKLEGSDEEIAAGWNAIFIAEISETLSAIRQIGPSIPCYAFTNTNAAHQAAWSSMFPAVAPLFKRVFSSWELGLRKPEQRAFAAVVDQIGVPAHSILFFDDTLENIEQAKRAGLQTVHVGSAADTTAALAAL